MESPKITGEATPQCLPQVETDYIVESLAKETPMGTSKYLRVLPGYWLTSTNRCKAPLLEMTLITEHRELEVVPHFSIYPYRLVFMALEDTLHITRGER